MRRFSWFTLVFLITAPLFAQLPPPQEEKVSDETKAAVEVINEAAQKGDLGEEAHRITVQGQADLNYVFAESPDSFIVTYKFRMEGVAKNQVDIIKGMAEITTGIEGFLAKWPTGECALNISVGEFPFEIVFNKTEEEQIRLDIRFIGDILEKWESNCSFIDTPSKFHTSGTPEQWVIKALKRPTPSFTDLTIPIDRLHRETSKMKFEIESFLIPDPPLGSAELKGKGTLTVSPERL